MQTSEPSYLDFYKPKPKPRPEWLKVLPDEWESIATVWKGRSGREIPVYRFRNKITGLVRGVSGWDAQSKQAAAIILSRLGSQINN